MVGETSSHWELSQIVNNTVVPLKQYTNSAVIDSTFLLPLGNLAPGIYQLAASEFSISDTAGNALHIPARTIEFVAIDSHAETTNGIGSEEPSSVSVLHHPAGDVDMDGDFDQDDLHLLGGLAFDTAATWSTGDFDADGYYTHADLILAFQGGWLADIAAATTR